MFADPAVALMVMLFLCFIGMLVMFMFVIRAVSLLSSSVKDGLRQQNLALADMERQLMDMTFLVRNAGTARDNAPLASESDSPSVMTDGELSSLLSSIGSHYTGLSEAYGDGGGDRQLSVPAADVLSPSAGEPASGLPDLRLVTGNGSRDDGFPDLSLDREK